MAGKFYLETTELDPKTEEFVIYELHATTNISISLPSTLTTYPIEDGSEVADNIVVKNQKITLSGIITDVSQASNSVIGAIADLLNGDDSEENDVKSVEQYIEQLKERIGRKETFSVYFSNVLQPLHDCVITNFTYSKTNALGGEAWQIKMTITQARFADRARFVSEPAENFKTLTESKKQSTANKSDVSAEKQQKVKEAPSLVNVIFGG